jgi:hypothetical protein
MTDARERLSRLIELASESTPDKQRALAFELCDLLTDWPQRYPVVMREPFEALLENVLRRLDGTTRRMIAERIGRHPDTALVLLNAFYLDMPVDVRPAILARNADGHAEAPPEDEPASGDAMLIDAARRSRGGELAGAFGAFLQIAPSLAQRILEDASGDALAVACKGAGVRRATYSALALLTMPDIRANPGARFARLSAIDAIPVDGAARMLGYWRMAHDEPGDARAA